MSIFSNQAKLTYDGFATHSNFVTGEIVSVLSASKTAVCTSYRFGDRITYIIRITNSGTTVLSDISLSDNLGAYCFSGETLVPLDYVEGSLLYYIDGILQPTPVAAAGPPLVVDGLCIPAGSSALLIYETFVNAFAPAGPGGSITNTATAFSNSLSAPLEATETVTAAGSASLIISKSLCPASVTENGRLTYTFVIQNIGTSEATAEDAAAITDTFDPALSGVSVTYNGIDWSAPENFTYDEASGLFSTLPGQITVPAATFVQDPVTGKHVMTPGVATVQVSGIVQ
ncbi:MAG: hypothetical protein IJN25_02465 [Clostridia bacterium]|nr:hypothetical protein [Clostridia bacterium]